MPAFSAGRLDKVTEREIVADEEFLRAWRYGDTAIKMLKKGVVPPYPQFYELLYTYASGVNPALNARINERFSKGDVPDTELVDVLCDEFLRHSGAEERLTSVSEEIANSVEAVHEAIDNATLNASHYSGLLQTATGDLELEMSREELSALSARLLSETRKMQTANNELEEKLDASRENILTLKKELEEVRRESMIDPLTKIYNRKRFDTGLTEAVEVAEENGEALTLLLLDIDHFKKFNDTYSHQVGDQVLRLVAMTMNNCVRSDDLAARYGGEEFAVIMPQTEMRQALKVAENMRRMIEARDLLKRSTNEKLGNLTVSIGAASYRAGDSESSLIERADKCLYQAKNQGRNCVVDESRLSKDGTEAA